MSPFVGDFDPLDPEHQQPKKSLARRPLILIVCLGLLTALVVGWFLYDPAPQQTLPVIQPTAQGSHKVLRSDPDTSVVPHQDKTVYQRIQNQEPPQLQSSVTLEAQKKLSERHLVTRETPIPVKEGLRVYAPPPPGLPDVEDPQGVVSEDTEDTDEEEDLDEEEDDEDDENASEPSLEDVEAAMANPSPSLPPSSVKSLKVANHKAGSPRQKEISQKAETGKTSTPKTAKLLKTTPTSSGTNAKKAKFQLQIASSSSRTSTEAEWTRLSRTHAILRKMPHQIVSVDLGAEKGVRYRLYVGGWASYEEAKKARQKFEKAGISAIVAQP